MGIYTPIFGLMTIPYHREREFRPRAHFMISGKLVSGFNPVENKSQRVK